ncbi:hypothetical protein P3L10_020870 [Capsicum annuum]
MDMVARVLKKYLKLDQREFQMNSLLRVYGYETRRSVAEALGLEWKKSSILDVIVSCSVAVGQWWLVSLDV